MMMSMDPCSPVVCQIPDCSTTQSEIESELKRFLSGFCSICKKDRCGRLCGCAFPCSITFKAQMLNKIHELLGIHKAANVRTIQVCFKHPDLIKHARELCVAAAEAKKKRKLEEKEAEEERIREKRHKKDNSQGMGTSSPVASPSTTAALSGGYAVESASSKPQPQEPKMMKIQFGSVPVLRDVGGGRIVPQYKTVEIQEEEEEEEEEEDHYREFPPAEETPAIEQVPDGDVGQQSLGNNLLVEPERGPELMGDHPLAAAHDGLSVEPYGLEIQGEKEAEQDVDPKNTAKDRSPANSEESSDYTDDDEEEVNMPGHSTCGTSKKLKVEYKGYQQRILHREMLCLVDDPRLGADVTFVCDDGVKILSSNLVLGAASDFLKELLLDPQLAGEESRTIVLPNVDSCELRTFLCLLFDFKRATKVSGSEMRKVLRIAKLFKIKALTEAKQNLEEGIKDEEAAPSENQEETSDAAKAQTEGQLKISQDDLPILEITESESQELSEKDYSNKLWSDPVAEEEEGNFEETPPTNQNEKNSVTQPIDKTTSDLSRPDNVNPSENDLLADQGEAGEAHSEKNPNLIVKGFSSQAPT